MKGRFSGVGTVLKCYAPFILILLAFISFRAIVSELSENIHYTLMPDFDQYVFGTLPTITLQHWLWHGHVSWYDFVFYIVYVSHYILPVILAWLIYKRNRLQYVRFAATYVVATFTAFIFFIVYPTAPPWMASQEGYIPHITRISSAIFSSLGIHSFASMYGSYAPDPIAALPSLHATYSILFFIFVYRYFGKRWAAVSLVYPLCIIIGVIYMGEHYAFDVISGGLLAVTAYLVTPKLIVLLRPSVLKLLTRLPFGLAPENPNE